jgi:hypothetical protein
MDNDGTEVIEQPTVKHSPQKGCLIVILLVAVSVFLMIRGGMNQMDRWREEYTETVSRPLPQPVGTDQEIDRVLDKVAVFVEQIESDITPDPLTLTANEINLWFYYHPEAESLAETVRVAIEADLLQANVSLPLDELGEWGKGRFLNGSVTLDVSVASGSLMVYLRDIEVGGKALPAALIERIKHQNLAEEFNQDPQYAALLKRVNLIYIRENQLWIVP